jgi:hypothetical protein
MADWQSFAIQIPGKDFLKPVREILETLLIFLEILKAILETIKIFLIDFGNPLIALLEALIRLIEELFEALKRSGFFMYIDVPNPIDDPNFNQMRGGFDAFTTRFKASLLDVKDFNRPQPRGSNRGGFIILMVDATTPWQLIQFIKKLLAFFGKGFDTPQYEAPENFRVIPVGDSGDPILAAAKVFSDGPIESIQLQWTLPSIQESPDPGFSDLLQQVWGELVPPAFLIERSVDVNPASRRIDVSEMNTEGSVGIVEYDRELQFELGLGRKVTRKETLLDDSGEPVIKFQNYYVVGAPTQILGLLGKFRFLDNDVEVDKDYYYRVRAFVGDLDFNEGAEDSLATGKINFDTDIDQGDAKFRNNTIIPAMKWPSKDPAGVVGMGKPTGILKARIPPDVGDFDVIETLKAVFKTAFSLGFHEIPPVNDNGTSRWNFNDDGTPKDVQTPVSAIGKGSLTNVSGMVSGWESASILSFMAEYDTIPDAYTVNSVTGVPPEMPWTRFLVIRQSARLADAVATAMMQIGADVIYSFRDLMRSLPRGSIDSPKLDSLATMEKVVFQMTEIEEQSGDVSDVFTQRATLDAVFAYLGGYHNVTLRLSVLDIINFIKSFTLGGVPPDWISIVPLRDIIPWSGSFLYDLLDKIRALIDAFNGIMQEIINFIDLLIRKIEALEAFIQFLIDLLNFIESLEFGSYLLSVPQVDGTVSAWINAVDTAGGIRPPSGPGGYSAGVALAYVAPNIDAFVTAFSIIFGG